jgi:thioredoxin-related protein
MKVYILIILLLIAIIIPCSCSNTDKYIPTKGINITPAKTTPLPTTKEYVTSSFKINRIWVSLFEAIIVEITPNSKVKANTLYRVQLYEKGNFREQITISFNQPEINVNKMKPVNFHATRQEAEAYCMEKDLSNIFSVKIYEVPIQGE